jgi:DNA-binding response OmpR family regulator
MPRLDGFKLCRALRLDPRLHTVPVVLISSAAIQEPDRELARSAGADCYITRTPDSGEILRAVSDILAADYAASAQVPSECPPGLRHRFLTGGVAECRQFIDAVAVGGLDERTARETVHRWAGVGGTLGFPQISQLAYQIELDLENTRLDSSPNLRPTLEDLEALFHAALRRLPVEDTVPPEPPPVSPLRPEVVVADDDLAVAALVTAVLKKHGVACAIARHGREALHMIRELKPGVLVLDINMPEMDGFEVLAALKRDRTVSSTAVVMLTARQREADVLRGFGLGVDDYIVKPFGPMELVARVKRLLRPASTLGRSTCSAS